MRRALITSVKVAESEAISNAVSSIIIVGIALLFASLAPVRIVTKNFCKSAEGSPPATALAVTMSIVTE